MNRGSEIDVSLNKTKGEGFMEWFQLISILSIILLIISAALFYQLRNQFKKLKIGEKLGNEIVYEYTKKIKIATTLLVIGVILEVIVILLRPF